MYPLRDNVKYAIAQLPLGLGQAVLYLTTAALVSLGCGNEQWQRAAGTAREPARYHGSDVGRDCRVTSSQPTSIRKVCKISLD